MNEFKTKLVALWLALSLCVTWFYLMRDVAPGNRINTVTPVVFASDLHGGDLIVRPMRAGTNPVIAFLSVPATNASGYHQLSKVWQPRIAGPWIAGHLLQRNLEPLHVRDANGASIDGEMVRLEPFRNIFGLYQAGWLMMTFLLLICFVDNPVFIVPTVFAAACYALMPTDIVTMYPWDMPSMFCFTLAFLLWTRGWFVSMLVTIVAGTAFKETVAVTAFLYLFTRLGLKQKMAFFGAAFLGCLLLKLYITHIVMGHARLFTADLAACTVASGKLAGLGNVGWNLQRLFSLHLDHFIWTNAGLFVLALALPVKTLEEKGIKFVVVIFFVGQFLAGSFQEFREFLDVLPMTVLYLARTVERWQKQIRYGTHTLV